MADTYLFIQKRAFESIHLSRRGLIRISWYTSSKLLKVAMPTYPRESERKGVVHSDLQNDLVLVHLE